MPTPITEFAYLTLKPGVDVFDTESDSSASKTWQQVISAIRKREGYQRLRYGTSLEIPDLLMLIIDWDDIEFHQAFIADPSYKPFKDLLGSITTNIHLHHAVLTPFPPELLDRVPCVEFATFYNVEPGFLDNAVQFLKAAENEGQAQSYLGGVFGETIESDVTIHGKGGDGGNGGKAVVLAIGWQTKEDHMKFRETESFAKNIHLLREKKGSGAEVFHVIPFTPVD